jgi:hypothetical protein
MGGRLQGTARFAFQWLRGALFLEIGFCDDGTISWFVRGAKGEDSRVLASIADQKPLDR